MSENDPPDYDLFVIGGGSGGLSAAKRAAKYGAKVAIAEPAQLGGTCAARGCIPKKLMVYASEFAQSFADAVSYGWSKPETRFDWQKLIATIAQEIQRLDQVHRQSLEDAKVTLFCDKARFVDAHTLTVGKQQVTAETILIAVGNKAVKPKIPGAEHSLISDQMFVLPTQPQRLAIVGGGYIGIEFAGIMQALGTQVTQIVREDMILEQFDQMIRTEVQKGMSRRGVNFLMNTEVTEIRKVDSDICLQLTNGTEQRVDAILLATGRTPDLAELQLENAGVELNNRAIVVDRYHQTNQSHIYAVGDCTNRVQLTPVAIAEAKAFADTVFGKQPRQVNYSNIPTSVFSQPQAASVGFTEAEAAQQLGADAIVTYCTSFQPLSARLTDRDEPTCIKLVANKQTDQIIGAHLVGNHAAEIIQAVAIAVTAGLTKADFNATMPLHPTSAEELVTLELTQMPEAPVQPRWMGN